jgi:hypothetical protein
MSKTRNKTKAILLGALVAIAVGAPPPPSASAAAVRYTVNGAALVGMRNLNGSLIGYNSDILIETYANLVGVKKSYALRCEGTLANSKIKEGGESERELILSPCRLWGYTEKRAPMIIDNCAVTRFTLKFAGALSQEVVGNDLWTGSEEPVKKRAGTISIFGGGLECPEGDYEVKGEEWCSILEPELERSIHAVLCAPAGIPNESALLMKNRLAGEPEYQLRLWYSGVMYVNENFRFPKWGVWSR